MCLPVTKALNEEAHGKTRAGCQHVNPQAEVQGVARLGEDSMLPRKELVGKIRLQKALDERVVLCEKAPELTSALWQHLPSHVYLKDAVSEAEDLQVAEQERMLKGKVGDLTRVVWAWDDLVACPRHPEVLPRN